MMMSDSTVEVCYDSQSHALRKKCRPPGQLAPRGGGHGRGPLEQIQGSRSRGHEQQGSTSRAHEPETHLCAMLSCGLPPEKK